MCKHRLVFLGVVALVMAGYPVAATAVVYVDKDATGAGNGTSWPNAFTTIQQGVDAAHFAEEVWVAEGVYDETRLGDPDGSLVMRPFTHLYGGFTGTESNRDDRNWDLHTAVIDGANGRGIGSAAFHVVKGANNATLDGFTVRHGAARSVHSMTGRGGGMLNDHVSPHVAHCLFIGNSAMYGGGMNNYYASPTIEDCTFESNTANDQGGGVENYRSSLTMTRCVFRNNQLVTAMALAGIGGGGLLNYISTVHVVDCYFVGNTVVQTGSWMGGGGGALNCDGTFDFTNCVFWHNSVSNPGGASPVGGGAVVNGSETMGTSVVLTNCTFWGNSAAADTAGGGAVGVVKLNPSQALAVTLSNCILWDDVPDEIRIISGSVTATYSDIEGGFSGAGNIGASAADYPLFRNPAGGDFHLTFGSPCIDSGTPVGAPSADMEGLARPQGAQVDRGAYEASEPPVAAFLADPLTGHADLPVQFTDQSTPGSHGITEWAWTFGDGETSNEPNPVHIYTTPGVFSVSLNVTTAIGSDEELKDDLISVAPPLPASTRYGIVVSLVLIIGAGLARTVRHGVSRPV